MLRGNLSTRPFYNERLATWAVVLVAVSALLLTIYNVTELVSLSSQRRELRARIDRDQSEATRIRTQATALQQSVDRVALGKLADSTGEANDLIDQRTFSWTAFFALLEKTLPIDVRLVMVSPRVERGVFRVAMTVVARDLGDVATFVDAVTGTGRFYDVAPMDQTGREDGTYAARIEASYLSPEAVVDAAKTVAAPAVAAPTPVSRPPR